MNKTCGATKPGFFVASYYIILPTAVSSFIYGMDGFVSHYDMFSVRRIRGQELNLWVLRMYGRSTNIFSRDNRYIIWEQIRGI